MKNYFLMTIIVILLFQSCSNTLQYLEWNGQWTYLTGYAGTIPEISFEYPEDFCPQTPEQYKEQAPSRIVSSQTEVSYFHFVHFCKCGIECSITDSDSSIVVILHIDTFITQAMNDPSEQWRQDPGGKWTQSYDRKLTFLEWYLTIRAHGNAIDQPIIKQLKVDGNESYSIEFEYDRGYGDQDTRERNVIRTVFEYDGTIVEFDMNCWTGEADEMKAHYQHLLDTFHITEKE